MPHPLRALILEDRPADAELMMQELRRAGYAPDWRRVDSEPEFIAALDAGFDIILADFRLPRFTALHALRHVQMRRLDIPFLVITGALDDEEAVECLKQGASDYLLKDRLARLGPAVTRAIEENRRRRARGQAEKEQARFAAHLRLLLDSTGEGLYGTDTEGRCTFINKAAAVMLGYAPDDLLGRNMHEVLHRRHRGGSPSPDVEGPIDDALRSGRSDRVDDAVLWRRDGTAFLAACSSHPLDDGGVSHGAVVTFTDLTERRGRELRLRQAQRLEAMRRLSGAVAHDFRQVMTAVSVAARLLRDSLDPKAPRHREAAELTKAGDRAAALIRQLLAFSRAPAPLPSVSDINDVAPNLERTPDADEIATTEPAAGPFEAPRGSETILLVEDEALVRTLTSTALQFHGYAVLEAQDGTEALRVCREHAGPIHLLITNVVMPGLNGREVAERLAPGRPAMKVLYLSGSTSDAIVHHGALDAGTAFLQKPFTPETLARKVREVLDARGEA